MKTTAYVTHPDCSLHDTGWAHPDHQGRLAGIARAVYRDMLALHEPLVELEPEPAGTDDLLLAHSAAYIERVRGAAEEAERVGRVQTFGPAGRVSGRSWDAARAAVGCGIAAVDAVLGGTVGNAFCAVRPPGNDVGVDGGRGYGLFNTAAIAAVHALRRRELKRVLILELVAAAGWGTAEIAARHPGIAFTSVHQRSGGDGEWPEGVTAVALEPGAASAEAIHALERALTAAHADPPPDLIILSLGLDILAADPVGGLRVDPGSVHDLTRVVTRRAGELCGGRLVSVLEGGYDAQAAGSAVVQHLHALAGLDRA